MINETTAKVKSGILYILRNFSFIFVATCTHRKQNIIMPLKINLKQLKLKINVLCNDLSLFKVFLLWDSY